MQGATGPAGSANGTTLYLNYNDVSFNVSGYKYYGLDTYLYTTPGTSNSVTYPVVNGYNGPVGNFTGATDPSGIQFSLSSGIITSTTFAASIWDLNLWTAVNSYSSNQYIQLYWSLYYQDPAAAHNPVLICTSDITVISNLYNSSIASLQQTIITGYVPSVTLPNLNTRVFLQINAQRVGGASTITLYLNFEGSTTPYAPSHFHTSLISNSANKTFVVDHPVDTNKYLVHACLEGPEAGVYYRGKAEITNDASVTVALPSYVSALARDFTVQITPIYDKISVKNYNVSEVENNEFTVYGKNGKFYWVVYGMRSSIEVEPDKSSVVVKGDGPYLYL